VLDGMVVVHHGHHHHHGDLREMLFSVVIACVWQQDGYLFRKQRSQFQTMMKGYEQVRCDLDRFHWGNNNV
jgi:beta-lactamase superfamily II metal-dependent hydrolase